MLEPRRLVPAVIAALLAGSAWLALPSYLERRQQNAEVAALLGRSRAQIDAGDHASAWKTLEQANAVAPTSRDVFSAQEQLAMKRLRGAGLRYGSGGRARDEDLVATTLPVPHRGASDAKGERLANLLAHMGWADYLRGGLAWLRRARPREALPPRSKPIRPTSMRTPCGVSSPARPSLPHSARRGKATPLPRLPPAGASTRSRRSPRCCRRTPTPGSRT